MNAKKYLATFAAFLVGVTGAIGYGAYAATTPPAPQQNAQVQTTSQDPHHLDGEQADDGDQKVDQNGSQDAQEVDGEQADDQAGADVEDGTPDSAPEAPGTEIND